jgi:hypothetical protein
MEINTSSSFVQRKLTSPRRSDSNFKAPLYTRLCQFRHRHRHTFAYGNDDLRLHLSSGSPHRHGEASPISTLAAQPMIGKERMRPKINDAPGGWSSTFDTVDGKYCRFIYIFQHDRDTTGLCVTFGGAVDWKSRQLKLTAQSTTKFRHWPMIDASCGMCGSHFGGAQVMGWFGLCLLSSVCFLSVFQWLSV